MVTQRVGLRSSNSIATTISADADAFQSIVTPSATLLTVSEMGGNAFNTLLPDALFPRMSTEVYQRLKARLTSRLQDLYTGVAVPREDPEKIDHGDLDFVVYGSREGLTSAEVCEALGAQHSILLDGNRMSNFAVPADTFDAKSQHQCYHQVDVRVCNGVEEWERVVSFNSFGDLGRILGLVARGSELSLGSSGLRVRDLRQLSELLTSNL